MSVIALLLPTVSVLASMRVMPSSVVETLMVLVMEPSVAGRMAGGCGVGPRFCPRETTWRGASGGAACAGLLCGMDRSS
eukprot:12845469-Alexandrium_andersonii.AAC.1